MEKKLYEMLIEEDDQGVYAMSLVENPAIEVDFVYFNKEKDAEDAIKLVTLSKEQRLVMGPALIPGFRIPREGGIEIVYSKKSVKLAAHKFMKDKLLDSVTWEHEEDNPLVGVEMVESWIIEDPKRDKAFAHGYNLPKGTWMAMYKIEDENLWERIKAGEVKGFSIEGFFAKKEKNTKMNKTDNKEAQDFLSKLKNYLNLAAKEEELEKKEEEKMMEDEKKEELEEVSFPLGTIDIPEDLEDEKFEVEANGKKYYVHVYVEQEDVEDPANDGEPVEDPDAAVADELSKVKAELTELKKFINEAATEVKTTKTQSGHVVKQKQITDHTALILEGLKNKK